MTKKLPCNCKHEFQDAMYGRGVRIFNEVTKLPFTWRCTVCGTTKTSGEGNNKKK